MNEVKVDQEVAVDGYHGIVFGYKVTKITPTGQVVAVRDLGDGGKITKRFDKEGRAVDKVSSPHGRETLRTDIDVAREEVRKRTALRAASVAISVIQADPRCNPAWGVQGMYEELDRLEAKIKLAREKLLDVNLPVARG
jgi:hypothetical protein